MSLPHHKAYYTMMYKIKKTGKKLLISKTLSYGLVEMTKNAVQKYEIRQCDLMVGFHCELTVTSSRCLGQYQLLKENLFLFEQRALFLVFFFISFSFGTFRRLSRTKLPAELFPISTAGPPPPVKSNYVYTRIKLCN